MCSDDAISGNWWAEEDAEDFFVDEADDADLDDLDLFILGLDVVVVVARCCDDKRWLLGLLRRCCCCCCCCCFAPAVDAAASPIGCCFCGCLFLFVCGILNGVFRLDWIGLDWFVLAASLFWLNCLLFLQFAEAVL